MSDIATWRVMTDERNPHDVEAGVWCVAGWGPGKDTSTAAADTIIAVEHGGRALADLIVASLQTTSKIVENVLAEQGKAANRGLDPRGWRYAPTCQTCKDTGTVCTPDLPGWVGHCDCKIGRRLLDLHLWEKARDNAEHDEWLQAKHEHGMEHPDDPYKPGPDEGPF